MFNFFKKDKDQNENSSTNNNVSEEVKSKSFWSLSLDGLKNTIFNTSQSLVTNVLSVASGNDKIDEFVLEDMEDLLIKADIGLDTAVEIIDKIRKENPKQSELKECLKNAFKNILDSTGSTTLNFKSGELNIYLVTGVNGVGKTTFIGKLANKFRLEGEKVLIAAGDTFRAAAEEQLDIWAKKAEVDIIRHDKADASSVVYEAIQKAQAENYTVLIIDTAGRLQNKLNLMEELKKIRSVIDKLAKDNLKESMLVIDANTGQNGLLQAKVFYDAVDLTSVVLTKLDGSAKGGIIIGIAKTMKLPVKIIGIGEKITDIRNFDKEMFLEALFE